MGWIVINVNKKYDFDNLSQQDIETLIEDKLQKNIDKSTTGTERKAQSKKRVGDVPLLPKGKIKIELSKDVDATKLTLEEVQEM
jgi:DNA topoisomerase-1